MLCPRYSGPLSPTALTATRLTIIFWVNYWSIEPGQTFCLGDGLYKLEASGQILIVHSVFVCDSFRNKYCLNQHVFSFIMSFYFLNIHKLFSDFFH